MQSGRRAYKLLRALREVRRECGVQRYRVSDTLCRCQWRDTGENRENVRQVRTESKYHSNKWKFYGVFNR